MVFSFSFLSVVCFSFSLRVVPREYMLKIRHEKRSYYIRFEKCVYYFLASSYPQDRLLSMVRLIEVLFFKVVNILSLKYINFLLIHFLSFKSILDSYLCLFTCFYP